MNINAKVDWIGTPRVQSYEQDGCFHTVFMVDFTLAHDDTRYKLLVASVVHPNETKTTRYEMKKYGVKPGSQKPFIADIGYTFENETIPLIDTILQDPYVKSFLI